MTSLRLSSHSVVKMESFCHKIGTKTGCSLSPLLLNTVLEVPPEQSSKKRNNCIQSRKGEVKLLADDPTLYTENPRDFTRNTVKTN